MNDQRVELPLVKELFRTFQEAIEDVLPELVDLHRKIVCRAWADFYSKVFFDCLYLYIACNLIKQPGVLLMIVFRSMIVVSLLV